MVAKIALFLTAFAAVAFAAPGTSVKGAPSTVVSQCNTGAQMCCNSIEDADSDNVAGVLGSVGSLRGIVGQVGLGCTSLLGIGSPCLSQPACCQGDTFNGLVNVGCSPISL